ncbi:MAG: cytochrome c [Gemmataceae bacterium]|nr:cytochrome c [Gemmataceae bacterium]
MSPWNRLCAAAVFGLVVAVVVGCGKKEPEVPAGPPPSYAGAPQPGGPGMPGGFGGPQRAKTGNAVFDQNCLKCHSVDGGAEGGGPKGKGGWGNPDLGKVAADPAHTPEWLAEHVRNPRAHNPGSKMPEFASKLSDEEIKSVVDYMAKLK